MRQKFSIRKELESKGVPKKLLCTYQSFFVSTLVFIVLMPAAILSCSKKSGKNQNESDGIQLLDDASKEKFAEWQKKLAKSCSASDVFGQQSPSENTQNFNVTPSLQNSELDLTVLAEKMQNKSFHEFENNSFFWLSSYSTRNGTVETSTQKSLNSKKTVSIRTKLENGNCKVFIFDELAYEFKLVSKVKVGGYYSPANLQKISWSTFPEIKKFSTPTSSISVSKVDVSGMSQILLSAFVGNLAESNTKIRFATLNKHLSNMLNLTEQQVLAAFDMPLSPTLTTHSAQFLLPNKLGASFTHQSKEILLEDADLGNLSSSLLDFDFTMKLPQVFESQLNANNTNIVPQNIEMKLQIERADFASSPEWKVSKVELISPNALPSDNFGSTCVKRELELRDTALAAQSAASTEFSAVFLPCAVHFNNYENSFVKIDSLKEAHLSRVQKHSGQAGGNFHGWDSPILNFATNKSLNAENFSSILDASNAYPIVAQMQANANLATSFNSQGIIKDLHRSFISGALNWALWNVEFSSANLDSLLNAVKNTQEVFASSTQKMVNEFFQTLGKATTKEFALSLTAEYKSTALEAQKLAQSNVGLQEISNTFSEALQKNVTLEAWKQMVSTAKAAESFLKQQELELAGNESRKSSLPEKLENIFKFALKEGWSASEFNALNLLVKPYKKTRGFNANLSPITAFVVADIGVEKFSKQNGVLADKYAGRYLQSVDSFLQIADVFSKPTNTQFLSDVTNYFYNPIWKTCSNKAYAEKLQLLKVKTEKLNSIPDFGSGLEKFELWDEIRDTLSDCKP